MNILYCGDRGIEKGVLISALSLLKYSSEPLNIFLLTAEFSVVKKKLLSSHLTLSSPESSSKTYFAISEDFARKLEKVLSEVDIAPSNVKERPKVTLLDGTNEFIRKFPVANSSTSFTPGCMLRLYADMFDEVPDRILYLDNDIVAMADPAKFYNMDIEENEVAGVLDNYGAHFFHQEGRELPKDYLNSGVLLLNMKLIRETGLFAEARVVCRTKKMFMPDQSSLNDLCHTKKIMPRKYNEQAKVHKDTVFRHYTTTFQALPYPHPQKIKPWQINELHDILNEHAHDDILSLYEKYISEIEDD